MNAVFPLYSALVLLHLVGVSFGDQWHMKHTVTLVRGYAASGRSLIAYCNSSHGSAMTSSNRSMQDFWSITKHSRDGKLQAGTPLILRHLKTRPLFSYFSVLGVQSVCFSTLAEFRSITAPNITEELVFSTPFQHQGQMPGLSCLSTAIRVLVADPSAAP